VRPSYSRTWIRFRATRTPPERSHGELDTCAPRTDDGAKMYHGIYVNDQDSSSHGAERLGILLEVALSRTPAE
jgi:hypothetical protein